MTFSSATREVAAQRAVAEGLTEEELALFDIPTKPEPVPTKKEEAEVKAAYRELLQTLNREKLVLDWREKQQAKAGVMQAIKSGLRKLRVVFTRDLQQEKFTRTFAHIYDSYSGAGRSVYQPIRPRADVASFAPVVAGQSLQSANNGRSPATNACRKAATTVRFNAEVERRPEWARARAGAGVSWVARRLRSGHRRPRRPASPMYDDASDQPSPGPSPKQLGTKGDERRQRSTLRRKRHPARRRFS